MPPEVYQVLTSVFSGGALLVMGKGISLLIKVEHRLTAIETELNIKRKDTLK